MVEHSVEPPVVRGDELIVRCSHSGCNRTVSVETTLEAIEASGGDGWRLSFCKRADGSLAVDTVECPDHRVADAIDKLALAQQSFTKSVIKSSRVADELVE